MVAAYRNRFNGQFSEALYRRYLAELDAVHPGAISFRVAETPVFIDSLFRDKMLNACEHIADYILQPEFIAQTAPAIPHAFRIPGDTGKPHFMVFDFGVCEGADGLPEPQLVEMQGFPTLFAFQRHMSETARRVYQIPDSASSYLNGFTAGSYTSLLKEIIIGEADRAEVILLELKPHEQKTRIDFYLTEDYLGIKPVCITELEKEGRYLYYRRDGHKVRVRRIFNRLIFDELMQQPEEIRIRLRFLQEAEAVEWVTHPDWFYRISKYTLPFIRHRYVPETQFLHEVQTLPDDLSAYVVKPLFSFAGKGVMIDVTREAIAQIEDPHNWILQKKVAYAPVIYTPDTPAKVEVRLFYFWKDGWARPVAVHNLARLSKGKMIGVGFNSNETWVGGSMAYFV
ncbi:hypothetical protein [Filimonas effusa]|uniref:Circularly permuted type 2 ATP-grasp protein n=1 Tax=Filimonas effusa TaxID=2508721 RepID=A0A4Q1DC62_9BACT|nr:hypothetical protein [Filimonas effusa]RXK86119.1 hypothetical protein ESB13_04730 [Filimonas effusa]